MNANVKCECKTYDDNTQPHSRTCPNHSH